MALWIARSIVVLSLGDVFGYEEFAKAALGRALFDPLGVPLQQLAYEPYEIGGFAFSLLDALAFRVLGAHVVAVKVVALAWQTAVLVLVFGLALRTYGQRAAILSAALWILAPESLQKLSLLALGIHFEALLFHVAILLVAGRIASGDGRGVREAFALGWVSGAGLAFDLTSAAAIAAAGAVLLRFVPRSLLLRRAPAFVAGLGVGLAPWLWMWAEVGSNMFDLHGARLMSDPAGGRTLRHLGQFARVLVEGRHGADIFDVALRASWGVAGVAFALRASARSDARQQLVLAFLTLFALAYCASGLAVGAVRHHNEFSRPSPAWLPVVLLTSAVLLRTCSSSRTWLAWSARGSVAALLLLGVRSTALAMGPVGPARWPEVARTLWNSSGCNYRQSLERLYKHLDGPLEERVAVLRRLSDPDSELLEQQIGAVVLSTQATDLAQGLQLARRLGGAHWDRLALGLGALLWRESKGDLTRVTAVLAAFAPDEREVLLNAGGRRQMPLAMLRTSLSADVEAARRAGLGEAWFEGLGWRVPFVRTVEKGPFHTLRPEPFRFDEDAVRSWLDEQPADVRGALERGWRKGLAQLRAHPLP